MTVAGTPRCCSSIFESLAAEWTGVIETTLGQADPAFATECDSAAPLTKFYFWLEGTGAKRA